MSDDFYPASVTTALSPSHVGIEDLPHMPFFLSLYMQLQSPKARFEFPSITIQREIPEATHLRMEAARLPDGEYLSRKKFSWQSAP